MRATKAAGIAALLSFVAAAIGGVLALQAQKTKPIQVSYRDLHPEAQAQVDCLADNIYFEAATEPYQGQKAIALVTMNRVQSKEFPKTVCEVVKQKRKTTCQFSWWCDKRIRRQYADRVFHPITYQQIRNIALDVYLNHGHITDITDGALFYHADYVNPRWKHLHVTVKIGQHIFYRI